MTMQLIPLEDLAAQASVGRLVALYRDVVAARAGAPATSTVAQCYARSGIRCVSLGEYAAWVGQDASAPMPARYRRDGRPNEQVRRLAFCLEAETGWCTEQRAAGRCALSDGEWQERRAGGSTAVPQAQRLPAREPSG